MQNILSNAIVLSKAVQNLSVGCKRQSPDRKFMQMYCLGALQQSSHERLKRCGKSPAAGALIKHMGTRYWREMPLRSSSGERGSSSTDSAPGTEPDRPALRSRASPCGRVPFVLWRCTVQLGRLPLTLIDPGIYCVPLITYRWLRCWSAFCLLASVHGVKIRRSLTLRRLCTRA